MDKIYCSRCSKDITIYDKDGKVERVELPIVFQCKITPDCKGSEAAEWSKQQFGKYFGEDVEYAFCYECWIDSLMGR